MKKSEIAELLTVCAAFDQRTIGDADVEAWHALFAYGDRDLRFGVARNRIFDWYAHHRERITPADIIDPHPDNGMW